VHEHLRLLTFNSIVEANHLGTRAAAVREISHNIKRISTAWGEMTHLSAAAMTDISGLAEQAGTQIKAFEGIGSDGLSQAQAEIRTVLEGLRSAAAFASTRAVEIEACIATLQAKIASVRGSSERLAACLAHIDAALDGIDALQHRFGSNGAAGFDGIDFTEVENLYARSYTTEMEREVLRAALSGAPLPAAQQKLIGNDVELF
jgi:hypothetical protein